MNTAYLNLPQTWLIKCKKNRHMSIKQPAIDSQTLLALSGLIGKLCMEQNIDFMKCKQMNQDPRACLDKGGKVVSCVLMVMQTAEKKAASGRFKSVP